MAKAKKTEPIPFSLGVKAEEIGKMIEIHLLEERPFRQDIEKRLNSISGVTEKIKYLRDVKLAYYGNLTPSIVASSGVCSVYTPPGYELFSDRWITNKIKELEAEREVTTDREVADPMTVIDSAVIKLYNGKLAKALNKSGKWDTKIRCAAFCELLWDNGYLGEKKERVEQCLAFAKQWYPDLRVQLESSQRACRKIHKGKLAYLFNNKG